MLVAGRVAGQTEGEPVVVFMKGNESDDCVCI